MSDIENGIDNEELKEDINDEVPSSDINPEGGPDFQNDIYECESAIEAILFAAGRPVEYEKIGFALGLSKGEVRKRVADFAEKYNARNEETGKGIILVQFPDACQLCTSEKYSFYIREALGIKKGGNLSNSSLEVLAIIAYNQPVTRAYIDTVTGVDSGYTVSTLSDKGLIEACGRLDVPGRPIIYRTTDNFLRVFGLSSLSDLPVVKDEDGNVINTHSDGESQLHLDI